MSKIFAITSLVVQTGALVVGEVRIFPRETAAAPLAYGEWAGTVKGYTAAVPPGGLTTRIARLGASIGARLVDAQRDVAFARSEAKMARLKGLTRNHDPFSDHGLWGQIGVAEPERLSASPGRRQTVLRRQARAARIYVEAIQAKEHAPVRAVAQRLKVAQSAARDLVHQARVNGLLAPRQAKQGRAAGYLTTQAQQLLLPAVTAESSRSSRNE